MKIKDYIPGLFAAFSISSVSLYFSTLHASFDPLVIAIIIGMFLGNLIVRKDFFEKGVEGAIRIFLPAGIALYGTQLIVLEMSMGIIFGILAVFLVMFGSVFMISRALNLQNKIVILLASGLAVCGTAAIMIISPLIKARRSDTSIAVISVMMLGLTGMVLYPLLYDYLALSMDEFAFLSGTTLPMLGQVKVAAGSVCEECLSAAMKIKLIRISFLFFLVTVTIFLSKKEEKKIQIPWFIILFILFAVVVNVHDAFHPYLGQLKKASSFFLSTALAAIGFTVDFDSIIENGMAPLAAGFLAWSVVVIIIYIFISLL